MFLARIPHRLTTQRIATNFQASLTLSVSINPSGLKSHRWELPRNLQTVSG